MVVNIWTDGIDVNKVCILKTFNSQDVKRQTGLSLTNFKRLECLAIRPIGSCCTHMLYPHASSVLHCSGRIPALKETRWWVVGGGDDGGGDLQMAKEPSFLGRRDFASQLTHLVQW